MTKKLIHYQGHCTPFDQGHSVGEVCAILDQGERIYDLDKDFSGNSAMTLILDLQTWFKVTSHTSSKGTLQVKYESEWQRGEKVCPGLVTSDRQTEGRIDRLMIAQPGPNNFLFVGVHLNIQQLYIMISGLSDR